MEKNKDKNHVSDTTKANEHKNMPVKTPATDTGKNTAEDEGLNNAATDNNKIEPGTTPPGDE